MSETIPGQSDPFDRLRPEDFAPPDWDNLPPGILDELNRDKGGPGIVKAEDAATQHEFDSVREMIPNDPAIGLRLEGMSGSGVTGLQGFADYFRAGDTIPDIMRELPAFRRFQILHRDLADNLTERMRGVKGIPPTELHGPLFNAYGTHAPSCRQE